MAATTLPAQGHGFRRFWYTRVLSQTAQAAALYGLLVYLVAETESGIWPALFVVSSILPALVFGLIGGVVGDWLPQRPLMFALNLVRGLAILPLLIGELSVGDVFILTLVIWVVHQFYSPAESALLPQLVSRARLPRATSRYNLALPVAQLCGMVLLAPLALKFANIDLLLGACAALYLTANIALVGVRLEQQPEPEHDAPIVAQAAGFLRAGWRQIARDDRAFGALVDSVMIGIGLSALVVIVPQFLVDVLNTGADNTVFVFAPAALGLVCGLQVAPFLGRVIGHGRLATFGVALFSLSILAIGSVTEVSGWMVDNDFLVNSIDDRLGVDPAITTVMLLSLPAGFAVGLVNVAIRTVLVLRTAPETHARVFSTQMTIANFGALVPTIATGLLIDIVGVRPVAIIIAIAVAAGAILGRRVGRDVRTGQVER